MAVLLFTKSSFNNKASYTAFWEGATLTTPFTIESDIFGSANPIAQLLLIWPGESVKALIVCLVFTLYPSIVPSTATVHISPFKTAPATPEPPVLGYKLVEAS